MQQNNTRNTFIGALIILLCVGLFFYLGINLFEHHTDSSSNTPEKVSVASPATNTPVPQASAASVTIPSDWQQYPSDFGFTFAYPASWGVDDTTLNQFDTLHQAFLSYSNELTVYSSEAAESDHTVGPSLTITAASVSDAASLIHTTFNSSADWLNKSSTGLPPHATVTPLTIDGVSAVVLSGLTTPFGNYKAVYFYDAAHDATVRFDCYYTTSSSIVDTIIQTFHFTTTLTQSN